MYTVSNFLRDDFRSSTDSLKFSSPRRPTSQGGNHSAEGFELRIASIGLKKAKATDLSQYCPSDQGYNASLSYLLKAEVICLALAKAVDFCDVFWRRVSPLVSVLLTCGGLKPILLDGTRIFTPVEMSREPF